MYKGATIEFKMQLILSIRMVILFPQSLSSANVKCFISKGVIIQWYFELITKDYGYTLFILAKQIFHIRSQCWFTFSISKAHSYQHPLIFYQGNNLIFLGNGMFMEVDLLKVVPICSCIFMIFYDHIIVVNCHDPMIQVYAFGLAFSS